MTGRPESQRLNDAQNLREEKIMTKNQTNDQPNGVDRIDGDTEGQAPTARSESLERMFTHHRAKECALVDAIGGDRQRETQRVDASVNANAELLESLNLILPRIGESRQTGEFLAARWVYGHPPGLPLEDSEQAWTAAEPGEPSSVLYLPRPDSHNLQERKAWLVVDVSAEMWG